MKFMMTYTQGYHENEEINYDDFLRALDHYGSAFVEQYGEGL